MSNKHESEDKKEGFDDDEPGFRITLPFGLGWMRGNSHHLELLLPVLRWVVISSTSVYLGVRLVQEIMRFNALFN